MKSLNCVALFLLLMSGVLHAEKTSPDHRVMTWVPPYAINECQKRLNQSFKDVGMKNGLTHLALQFWNPTETGGLELVARFQKIDDPKIAGFRKWGKTHGVRVMLCVYNGTSAGWDWNLATSAFETHRAKFVDSIINEVLRLKLDGVDIDFEGKGKLDESKQAFLQFIKALSDRLHAEGKELTVNSFAYKWHAPNQTWWSELLPHVDGLQVMGYAETGAGATEWRSYESLKAAAGKYPSKLLIGMPSHVAEWQGKSAKQHLEWIVADGSVGMALWDAQLKSTLWRKSEVWKTIAKIQSSPEAQ